MFRSSDGTSGLAMKGDMMCISVRLPERRRTRWLKGNSRCNRIVPFAVLDTPGERLREF
jgi:hypothetical protein